MNITLNMPRLCGSVKAIASKSHAHRLLVCAALADAPTRIACAESSDDIEATAACLRALGAGIERGVDNYYVTRIPSHDAKDTMLDCGESGSTLRFLLPVAGALGVNAEFRMRGRLSERPMAPLIDALKAHGCEISGEGTGVLRCSGQLRGGVFTLPGDVSSQYISGLLFALPLLGEDSEVVLTSGLESQPYIQMTIDALRGFGVDVEAVARGFKIKGNQAYRTPGAVDVEGDWSNAAFWLGAGAIGRNAVECGGLDMDSAQGDKAIVALLKRFGANVRCAGGAVSVAGGALRGIEIDAADTPDLVPILAVVASVAKGRTVIRNAARLRIKESDRLRAVTETLRVLGADVCETDDGLVIDGKAGLRGGAVSACGDHRIAMAAAVASSVCAETVTIEGAQAVNKSYPDFFRDFGALSGEKEE